MPVTEPVKVTAVVDVALQTVWSLTALTSLLQLPRPVMLIAVGGVQMVIVISLLLTVVGEAQGSLLVIIQVILSPFAKVASV